MATTSDTDKSPRVANQAPRAHAGGGVELRHRLPLLRRCPPTASASRTTSARVLRSTYREVQVQIPVKPDRRADPRLLRLPRPAQRRARAVQGRHPLPPRGRPRRGARARRADDLEDRDRRRPVRRRQGRRQLRPARSSRATSSSASRRSFIDKIDKVLGPTRDIPAPDVNTNAQVMAWMMDEYGKLHGHTPAIVTGKPISLGGSLRARGGHRPRRRATATARPRRQLGLDPDRDARRRPGLRQRRLVGGADHRRTSGAKIVGVSDAYGAIHSDAGIDAHELRRRTSTAAGALARVRRGVETIIAPRSCSALECDVFIPAALGGMIHAENAAPAQAPRCVRRGRQQPDDAEADEILDDNGILVVPDVLANAGGVVVSYFEWVQNLQHFRWDEHEVNEKLGTIMRRAYREVAGRAPRTTTCRCASRPTSSGSSASSRRRGRAATSRAAREIVGCAPRPRGAHPHGPGRLPFPNTRRLSNPGYAPCFRHRGRELQPRPGTAGRPVTARRSSRRRRRHRPRRAPARRPRTGGGSRGPSRRPGRSQAGRHRSARARRPSAARRPSRWPGPRRPTARRGRSCAPARPRGQGRGTTT